MTEALRKLYEAFKSMDISKDYDIRFIFQVNLNRIVVDVWYPLADLKYSWAWTPEELSKSHVDFVKHNIRTMIDEIEDKLRKRSIAENDGMAE